MQHKVPFTNTHDHPVYSTDGTLVPPGETRMVTAVAVAAAPAAPLPPDALLELLDNKVGDIVPNLGNLDLAALQRLLAAEQDGKTRKSLIEAIELHIMQAEDAAKLAAEPVEPDAQDAQDAPPAETQDAGNGE